MFLKKRLVEDGFDKVRQDFSVVHEWLYYFYKYNNHLINFIQEQDTRMQQQETELAELKSTLQSIPKTNEDFKALVDSHYSFDSVMERLRSIENRIDLLESRPVQKSQIFQERPSIHERMLKKIARSSKDYIKNLVLNLVGKYGKVSALQLREMIVEEQGLCSKSSFYRILEELEREDELNIISKGKLKIYLSDQNNLRISN